MKSMLLVDILARDLDFWPHNALADIPATNLAQDDDGMICTLDPNKAPNANQFDGRSWRQYTWTGLGLKLEVSSDFKTAIVTRAEWQAAVDALNSEKSEIPALGEYWPGQGGHNGGPVAATDDVPAHYLIIAAKDAGSHKWGEDGSESKATSARDGFANTVTLMEGDHPAAKAATGYTADGHDNFYLPAAAELYQCWLNAPDLFAKDTWCWSSTQRSANYAFSMGFGDGYQGNVGKYDELRVRPVRRLFIDSFINSGGDQVKDLNVKAEQAAELKWPDGATHYVPPQEKNENGVFYLVVNDDAVYGWSLLKSGVGNGARVYGESKRHQLPGAILRPTERAVEWDGVGLPPVGVECEWHPSVHGWVKVKILGRDGSDTWYRAAGEDHSQTCRNMAFFRPIRTPEQIAAEERSRTIDDMVCALGMEEPGTSEYIRCGLIYDAGYRKQVEK